MPIFDSYIAVDWSAESRPKTGRDSIWIYSKGSGETDQVENPRTRHLAKLQIAEMLRGALARGGRVLATFDFPFGYPAGFAARLRLQGTPWRALWDEIARLLKDDPTNRSNRLKVGADLNRRVSGDAFPFWGCPTGFTDEFLRSKKLDRYAAEGLAEKRLIDEYMRGAQPCWKLFYPGSVGSQALTGIPVVRELRDDPRWRDHARIWPFETGLCLTNEARIIFAEIWPSWWDWKRTRRPEDQCNDVAQVRHVANVFAELDGTGELAERFRGPVELRRPEGRAMRERVEHEEAWALGVMEARRKGALH